MSPRPDSVPVEIYVVLPFRQKPKGSTQAEGLGCSNTPLGFGAEQPKKNQKKRLGFT